MSIAFLLFFVLFFVVIVMSAAFIIFGIVPYGIVNGLLAITGKKRPMPFWVMPYIVWGASITVLTLLSVVANWQTRLDYGGGVGGWAIVALIEAGLTAVGCGMAYRAFVSHRSRVRVAEAEGTAIADLSAKHLIYWTLWFVTIFILNWIIDIGL